MARFSLSTRIMVLLLPILGFTSHAQGSSECEGEAMATLVYKDSDIELQFRVRNKVAAEKVWPAMVERVRLIHKLFRGHLKLPTNENIWESAVDPESQNFDASMEHGRINVPVLEAHKTISILTHEYAHRIVELNYKNRSYALAFIIHQIEEMERSVKDLRVQAIALEQRQMDALRKRSPEIGLITMQRMEVTEKLQHEEGMLERNKLHVLQVGEITLPFEEWLADFIQVVVANDPKDHSKNTGTQNRDFDVVYPIDTWDTVVRRHTFFNPIRTVVWHNYLSRCGHLHDCAPLVPHFIRIFETEIERITGHLTTLGYTSSEQNQKFAERILADQELKKSIPLQERPE